MNLQHILGNARVKKTINEVIERNRPSHAYLFYGLQGVGKFSMAYSFALGLLGIDDQGGEKTPEGFSHPDLTVIEPDGQSVKIDQIRAITRGAAFKPALAERKIFIVNKAERLREEAANAILKILEEPPSFMVIILVTSEFAGILPTVRSRCYLVPFGPVSQEEIKELLTAKFGLDEEKAAFVAAFSKGSVGKALSLASDTELSERRDQILKALTSLSQGSLVDFLKFGKVYGERKESFEELLQISSSWYRDILVFKHLGEEAALTNADFVSDIKGNAGLLSARCIENILTHLSYLHRDYRRTRGNLNYRLSLEAFMLKVFSEMRRGDV